MARRRPPLPFLLLFLAGAAPGGSPTRPLPLLLFPTQGHPYSLYNLLTNFTTNLTLRDDNDLHDRIVGTIGDWLVVAASTGGGRYTVVNPFSREEIPLPGNATDLNITAIKLSAVPRSRHFSAVALGAGDAPSAAFWLPGSQGWSPQGNSSATSSAAGRIEDIVYHDGPAFTGFHYINGKEDVRAFTVGLKDDGELYSPAVVSYNVSGRPWRAAEDARARRRYLVVSRRRLLMVVRYLHAEKGEPFARTHGFKVFEMVKTASAMATGGLRWRWVERRTLDGQMLFVGLGSSTSVDASPVSGGGFEGDSIFFTDDDLGMACGGGKAACPCKGVGKYSMASGRISRYPLKELRSNLYSPLWYHPTLA